MQDPTISAVPTDPARSPISETKPSPPRETGPFRVHANPADPTDPEIATDPAQARRQGWRRAETGDLAGARRAFDYVVRTGDPEEAPQAQLAVGVLYHQWRQAWYDPAAAEAAYQRVVDCGHGLHAASAAFYLANLLEECGDVARARENYRRAARHPTYSQRVGQILDSLTAQAAADVLVTIFAAPTLDKQRVAEVGWALFDEAGNTRLMLLAHDLFQRRRGPALAHSLGRLWAGVGDWPG